MKNITLSADEHLIESAREKARAQHTTLNEEFRQWLKEYTGRAQLLQRHREVMDELEGKLLVGRKLTREEMNER